MKLKGAKGIYLKTKTKVYCILWYRIVFKIKRKKWLVLQNQMQQYLVWWIRCTLFVWTLDTYNLTQWTLNSGMGIVKNKLAVILNE